MPRPIFGIIRPLDSFTEDLVPVLVLVPVLALVLVLVPVLVPTLGGRWGASAAASARRPDAAEPPRVISIAKTRQTGQFCIVLALHCLLGSVGGGVGGPGGGKVEASVGRNNLSDQDAGSQTVNCSHCAAGRCR